MGLKDYHQKRNFQKTTEPKGGKKQPQAKQLEFVVQEHHATHLHYDFRLEADGVLKSWAVPKGPPSDPSEKRLAIQVEDHPFEYRTFEGTIPKGSYGAGTVSIWDHGTYHAEGASTAQESERLIRHGLQEGHINFILQGQELNGPYSLVRLKQAAKENQWLLLKRKEGKEENNQQSSPPSMQIKNELKKLPKSEMPKGVKPMLATLVDKPFDGQDWIFEIKWDGYRALAAIKKKSVHLYSRNSQLFDDQFPDLLDDLKSLPSEALLDGEIVVLDSNGNPSFQLVQNYHRLHEGTLVYYVFDLLYLDGHDLRQLPLIDRKKLLKEILPDLSHICYCDHLEEKGIAFFDSVAKKGLEGIMAKKAQSHYRESRSRDWLKIKTHQRQEAIICGFTAPQGSREYFGSLILGVYDQKKLIYVGCTGSGFDHKMLARVYALLQPLRQSKSPFIPPPQLTAGVTWVKPQIVCEVKFAEWTNERIMRQAIFLDIRQDKKSKEVVLEKTLPIKEVVDKLAISKKKSTKSAQLGKKNQSDLEFSHLDKVFWPEEGYTKGDLIDYYRQVAPLLVPYLKDRPETLKRFPNGIQEANFFQKEAGHAPDWVRTEAVHHEDREVRYLIIDDEKSLLYAVNLACIDFNPFNSRIQLLDYPDYLIMDLDPIDVVFDQVVEVAQTVHAVLEKWKIPSCCKTSGGRGMHIYIPLGALYSFEEAQQFAKLISYFVQERLPDLISLERSPQKRQKKVYLDYLQNRFGQTTAAPYSVRPRPGAPVSTPLNWTEVKAGLNPLDFNMKTVLKRFKKVGDLFKPILGKGINLKQILKQIS